MAVVPSPWSRRWTAPAVLGLLAPASAEWPIQGLLPYHGGNCPSPGVTTHILQDLESSCNIPKTLGLGTETDMVEGTMKDSLIYHTKWTRTSMVGSFLFRL